MADCLLIVRTSDPVGFRANGLWITTLSLRNVGHTGLLSSLWLVFANGGLTAVAGRCWAVCAQVSPCYCPHGWRREQRCPHVRWHYIL